MKLNLKIVMQLTSIFSSDTLVCFAGGSSESSFWDVSKSSVDVSNIDVLGKPVSKIMKLKFPAKKQKGENLSIIATQI